MYRFRCIEHGDSDFPDRDTPVCPCGQRMVRVFVMPNISATVTSSRRPETFATLQRERKLERDRDAYKRMRANGVQPRNIDGSARLEAKANTEHELKLGKVMPQKRVKSAVAVAEDVVGRDLEV